MTPTKVLFALISFAFAAQPAKAQNDTTTLNTVVISATKTPVARSQLTQSVTVLTAADLKAHGITRVSDALQLVPGVSIAQNGSFGSVASLFLRGGESRYTKILIDGVAVNQSGGYFDFSHLTTDNIERIEIVRGPASVLYGADAVVGAIQIFTRRGSGPLHIDASTRAGTYRTVDADLGLSGSQNNLSYSLGGAQHVTNGTYKFNNNYMNGTLSGSLGLTNASGLESRVNARYTNAEFHYPTDFTGAPVDSNSYRVQHRLTLGGETGLAITPSVTARLLAGTNEVSDLTEDIAIPFGSTAKSHSADKSRAHRRTLEARVAAASTAAANLTLGGEYVDEGEKSTTSRGPVGQAASPTDEFDASRHTLGGYAELVGSPARKVGYTIAGRLDDNSDYGTHGTYRLGLNVPVLADTRVRGSLSTAFNAPAFNQIRPTAFTVASPDLSPERARSWEVGIEELLDNDVGRVSVAYFNQRFYDLIQYVSGGPPTFKGSYANLTEAQSNGYEAELELTPSGVASFSASYTYDVPRVSKVSAAYGGSLRPGDALLRRPTHSGVASVRFNPRGGSVSLTANYIGKRPDIDFNQFPSPTVSLPSYVRVDAAASTDVWKSSNGSALSLTGRVENVFDKQYETVLHFPAPGRVILLGARFSGSL